MSAARIAEIVEVAILSLRLAGHPDRQDFEQEAALAVLEAEQGAAGAGNRDGYLYAVARNRILAGLKRRSRDARATSGVDPDMVAVMDRADAVGERWAEVVRGEVQRAAGDAWPVVARAWGLGVDAARAGQVADELGMDTCRVYQILHATKRRLQRNDRLFGLMEAAKSGGEWTNPHARISV